MMGNINSPKLTKIIKPSIKIDTISDIESKPIDFDGINWIS